MRLIDAEELERVAVIVDGRLVVHLTDIHNAPTVELDESIIQKVLNKRCMTAVANEYLRVLHNNRIPHGKWVFGGFCATTTKWYCDQCHFPELERTKFCPNCGATMEVKKNE